MRAGICPQISFQAKPHSFRPSMDPQPWPKSSLGALAQEHVTFQERSWFLPRKNIKPSPQLTSMSAGTKERSSGEAGPSQRKCVSTGSCNPAKCLWGFKLGLWSFQSHHEIKRLLQAEHCPRPNVEIAKQQQWIHSHREVVLLAESPKSSQPWMISPSQPCQRLADHRCGTHPDSRGV